VVRSSPETEHPDLRALFDASWYARRNGLAGEDAAWQHFINHRRRYCLEPNPLFDCLWYKTVCPGSGANDPLDHFLETSSANPVSPSPFFECEWYLEKYADVREAGLNPYRHFIEWGRHEGRLPNHWCDPAYTGDPTFDLDLPAGFNVEDLLQYISHYTTLNRLASGAEAGVFFSPKSPWWIITKVAAPLDKRHTNADGFLLGGRRESFSGFDVHDANINAAVVCGYRAYQVRYAVSPVVRNAITVLGRDPSVPDVQEEIAQAVANRPDVPLSEINLVVDTMFVSKLRRCLAGSPLAAMKIVTLDSGHLCRVKFF